MKHLIITFSLIFCHVSVSAQNVFSVDSTFQDPALRKAHIFEHLNLPDILWDNGLTFMDLSLFIDNEF